MSAVQQPFSKFYDSFIVDKRVQNVSRGTLLYYQNALKVFLEWAADNTVDSPQELTPTEVKKYLLYIEDRGHNAGGRHIFYRTLKTFLRFIEDQLEGEGWRNPIKKVPAPKNPQLPLDPIKNEDVEKLVATCDASFTGVRDEAILLTLLDTGLRASEATSIQLGDLDLVTGSIQVVGKGRKVRIVLFGKRTRKAIRAWLRSRGTSVGSLFIKQDGEPLQYYGLRMMLERRSKRAGIPIATPHDFRRAFCLNQLQAGVSETTIARLMGHSSTQLIARYAKQSPRHLRESFHSAVDRDL